MDLKDQYKVAIGLVSGLFDGQMPGGNPVMPEGMTPEDMWNEICRLRKELDALKKLKRGVKPRVEQAVKLLLEDPRLAEVSVPLIADIIKQVFNKFGVRCECSESSVRWYMSQRNLEWNIIRRRLPQPTFEEEKEPPDGERVE